MVGRKVESSFKISKISLAKPSTKMITCQRFFTARVKGILLTQFSESSLHHLSSNWVLMVEDSQVQLEYYIQWWKSKCQNKFSLKLQKLSDCRTWGRNKCQASATCCCC